MVQKDGLNKGNRAVPTIRIYKNRFNNILCRIFIRPQKRFKAIWKRICIAYGIFNSSNCNIVLCSKPFKCIFGCRYCNLCNDVNGWMQAVAFYVCWSGRSRGSSLVIIRELLKGDASDSFRMDRIMTFFDPWSDATGTGYQMVQVCMRLVLEDCLE